MTAQELYEELSKIPELKRRQLKACKSHFDGMYSFWVEIESAGIVSGTYKDNPSDKIFGVTG
jgi:hypothetical protein